MLLHLQYLPAYSTDTDDDPVNTRIVDSLPSSSDWKQKVRSIQTTTFTPDTATTACTNIHTIFQSNPHASTTSTTTTTPNPDTPMRILRASRPRSDGWHKIEKRRKTKMSYRLCSNSGDMELRRDSPFVGDKRDCKGSESDDEAEGEVRGRRVLVRRVFVRTSFWGNPQGLRRKRKRKAISTVLVTF